MANYESIEEPSLTKSEQDHLIPYRSRIQDPFLHSYDFGELYWRLVREYTGRDLSREHDALNAFSAFTGEFGHDGHRLAWGLPIVGIAQNLLWEHEPWDFREIRRRKDFPSWSWAGWSGKAAMNFPLVSISRASYVCHVAEESPRSRVLKCMARIAHVSVEGQAPLCSIAGASISSVMMDCGINAGLADLSQTCMLMEICEIEGVVWGLLVKQSGEYFERIGAGFVKISDSEVFTFEPQELKLT